MERLRRRLGLTDAVVVGLAAMVGAGVFVAYVPAAQAAGSGLLIGLGVAAVVATCNALSSARLAALHPEAGGTYVYGRVRLGPFWGFLAGWAFVAGKTASCAAMALTVGAYAWPGHAREVAVAVVVAVTALGCAGVQRSALAARVLVAVVITVLVGMVIVSLVGGAPDATRLDPFAGTDVWGILQAAAFLFFAFAGYARITTLAEEVRTPEVTIPRAVMVALGVVLALYLAVGVALLLVLGPAGVAGSSAPLAEAVTRAWSAGEPVVRTTAALAAAGALLSLALGVSRTLFAMGRDRELPASLGVVSRGAGVPRTAMLAVGAVVTVVVAAGDVRGAIGFSSFAVLTYYAIANASALTLSRSHAPRAADAALAEGAVQAVPAGREVPAGGSARAVPAGRAVPAAGLAGCLLLAATLPWTSVVPGVIVLLAGAAGWRVRHHAGHGPQR